MIAALNRHELTATGAGHGDLEGDFHSLGAACGTEAMGEMSRCEFHQQTRQFLPCLIRISWLDIGRAIELADCSSDAFIAPPEVAYAPARGEVYIPIPVRIVDKAILSPSNGHTIGRGAHKMSFCTMFFHDRPVGLSIALILSFQGFIHATSEQACRVLHDREFSKVKIPSVPIFMFSLESVNRLLHAWGRTVPKWRPN